MIRTLAAAAALLLATSAHAQFYGQLALATANGDLAALPRDRATALVPALGFKLSESFALEASYLTSQDFSDTPAGQERRIRGPGAALVGVLPVLTGALDVVGKIGALKLKLETQAGANDLGTRAVLGVGLQLRLEGARLRAMFEHVDRNDEIRRLNLFSLGVVVPF